MNKVTPSRLALKKKQGEKIVALTAYDFSMAFILDQLGIDVVLVGDSLGMVLLGYENTLPVTMEEMLHHTRAVSRGVRQSLVVADMPFMSYQSDIKNSDAVRNAGRFLKEAGAHAVKVEGGIEIAPVIKKMVDVGIPVVGHIGLKPQHVLKEGCYKVQAKTEPQLQALIEDAKALEASGAFAVVLEGVPASAAKQVTEQMEIPTIGIGAGPHCDGQILVINDLLGLNGKKTPKFVKAYAQLHEDIKKAVLNYKQDVLKGKFPDAGHSY